MTAMNRNEFRRYINMFVTVEAIERELIEMDRVSTKRLSYMEEVKHEGAKANLLVKRDELCTRLANVVNMKSREII
jgi:translation initiation factor 2 beta subunit (eIF-2beta)/eIF-5